MSIFKETFPRYVRKQLEVREALIQQGNEEANRFQSTTTKSGVTISPGAFYNFTTSKQRQSAGNS